MYFSKCYIFWMPRSEDIYENRKLQFPVFYWYLASNSWIFSQMFLWYSRVLTISKLSGNSTKFIYINEILLVSKIKRITMYYKSFIMQTLFIKVFYYSVWWVVVVWLNVCCVQWMPALMEHVFIRKLRMSACNQLWRRSVMRYCVMIYLVRSVSITEVWALFTHEVFRV